MGDAEPRDHSQLPPPPCTYALASLTAPPRPSVSWVLRVSPRPGPACSAASSKDRVLRRMFSCPACPFLQSSALCRAQACPPLKGERSWKPRPVFHFKQKAGLAPLSAHSQPRGFQLGPASARNEEWARPAFGDVRWKLRAANSGFQLCFPLSHCEHLGRLAASGGASEPAAHRLLSRPGPRRAARPASHLVSSHNLAGPTVRQAQMSTVPHVSMTQGSPSLFGEARNRGLERQERTWGCTRKP